MSALLREREEDSRGGGLIAAGDSNSHRNEGVGLDEGETFGVLPFDILFEFLVTDWERLKDVTDCHGCASLNQEKEEEAWCQGKDEEEEEE